MMYSRAGRRFDYLTKCSTRIARTITKEIQNTTPDKEYINRLFDQANQIFELKQKYSYIKRRHYIRHVKHVSKRATTR